VFWSKIWFFIVAIAGAIALTIALVLPRPAVRAMETEEQRRLTVACSVVNILLTDDARKRVDLAGLFARSQEIVTIVDEAGTGALDEARMKGARAKAEAVMKGIKGDRKPDFAMLIERRGRVVARVGLDERLFGDLAAGRPLVEDALAGYLRDDLWSLSGTLYFVSASPVVKAASEYVGAVVLGHRITNELAQKLVASLGVDIGFYIGDNTVAGNRTIALDQSTLQTNLAKLTGPELQSDCKDSQPFPVRAGTEQLAGIVARLPGEASARGAFYTVMLPRRGERGFFGSLKLVTKTDLSFGSFPWFLVGGGLLLVLGGGIALMLIEADRPLRRLAAEAVRLAKGDIEKLGEDAHPGKFGSIARSVNIHLDKMGREARTSKKDIEQMLGPAPEGSLGTIDLLANALPVMRPGGPAPSSTPPPSEFRFTDSSSSSGVRPAPVRPGTPPPVAAASPPARPSAPSMPGMTPPRTMTPPHGQPPVPPRTMTPPSGQPVVPRTVTPPAVAPPAASTTQSAQVDLLDDEAFDLEEPAPADRADPYFKQVFDQFVTLKKNCGESIAGLTYDKFVEKLIRNRDELRAKTGCREVRFTVYAKDGKAALKATPVKED
jgi:hypothetical protein